jgi:hypothetical protein
MRGRQRGCDFFFRARWGRRCVGGRDRRYIFGDMDRYRIIPAHRGYKVVVMEPDGRTQLLKTWPTEEAAIAHLRLLRQRAELIDRQMAPTPERNWRG